ncbi:MAG: protogloblin ApPgb, partial [Acidobacteria bacterium]|nr:protogloblin ApPgb [Acidobacteriota bacterium]
MRTNVGNNPSASEISGYTYGRASVARSPVSLDELRQLEATVGWTDEDARVLQQHRDTFEKYAEDMVGSWREVIASQPHLAKWFFGPDGKPDEEYKARVKKRFVQWVLDVCLRAHDQEWLDYQEEIGLRHTPAAKNRTDGRQTPPWVPLRYVLGFIPVVTITTRKFFVASGIAGEELQKLEDA